MASPINTQHWSAVIALLPTAFALNNGLGTTPQMGWNDCNAYGCSISRDLVLTTASSMAKYGLQAEGYHYVNMDDCRAEQSRNSTGGLVADPTKFPNGIAYVADQVHTLGLKFGMYSDARNNTCAGYPGNLGHEQQVADTFANWGVDYSKYDNCNNDGSTSTRQIIARYTAMGDALNKTGRPFFYSLCEWGENDPWLWAPSIGNSWRISGDIGDCWNTYLSGCALPGYGCYECSAVRIATFAGDGLAKYGGPGGWNDLDMLEVGNGAMTDAEEVAHFSLSVNQDPLGIPASLRSNTSDYQVYSGPLQSTTGGKYQDYVVGIVNLASTAQNISIPAKSIFNGTAEARRYKVYDLWANRLTSTEAQIFLTDGASAHQNLVYNATRTSYAQGLAKKNSMLLGGNVGSMKGAGHLSVQVPSNAGVFYLLRVMN